MYYYAVEYSDNINADWRLWPSTQPILFAYAPSGKTRALTSAETLRRMGDRARVVEVTIVIDRAKGEVT